MSYLVVGFIFQAVGYSLDIAGVQSETGPCRLLAGLAMAALAGVATWIAWELLRGPRLRALPAAIEREKEAAGEEIDEAEGEAGEH